MNKKIILTTAAVLATVATAGGVKADEFNGDLTKDSIGLTAETGNSTSATEATVSSAQGEHEGNPGNIEGDRAVDEEDPSRGSNATSFAKDGDIIRVENPEVVIDQSKGTGKYQGFTVEYKNVHFPDDMQINQGDKVTFNLPEEITFQTAYEFDVTNPDNNVVGKASTDPASQTVTMDLIKSMSKSEHGFEITMDRLDRMVYIWYKTKLTNAVKDSTNPINKVELKAENDGATSKSSAHLVGGKGDASGENKPETTFEIPKESPKVEIPEFEGGIPGIPEVREKPEYTEPIGTVPNDSPILEKPEWHGGTVPFDAPQIDKPEWSGGVVPNEAPMLELPELEIPDEPVKPTPEPKADQPQPKPEPKQDKPNTPAPKTETKKETVEVVNQGETKQDEPVEAYSAPAVLPATGSDLGLSLVALGISMATLAFTLKKKEN